MDQIVQKSECEKWGRLSEDRRAVCQNGKWFYIDEQGYCLTNGQTWKHASFFSDGFAIVADDQGEFHIGADFKPLYSARFKAVGSLCQDGRTWAHPLDGGEEVTINTKGEIIPRQPSPPPPAF